jgi:hypothetical protein
MYTFIACYLRASTSLDVAVVLIYIAYKIKMEISRVTHVNLRLIGILILDTVEPLYWAYVHIR